MSLFLNLLFETDSYSNEYLLAKIGVDTAVNELLQVLFNMIQYYSIVSLAWSPAVPDAGLFLPARELPEVVEPTAGRERDQTRTIHNIANHILPIPTPSSNRRDRRNTHSPIPTLDAIDGTIEE